MRNRFLTLGVVLAALGVFPAAAQAHHLEQDTSTITCVLANNAPVVRVSAHYVDFGPGDFPVSWSLRIDNDIANQGSLNWGSGDYFHNFDTPTTPGAHSVTYHASWPGNYGGIGPRPVVCSTPIPPPTLCNGVPMPPGTNCAPPPPATCNGVPLAPGANCASAPPVKPPCGCKHKPRPKPHCIPTKAHVKVYPLRRLHGEVIFTLAGVRRADVVSVRWAVHRPGHRWRHVGHSGKPWEHLAHRGLSWHIFLWVEKVWGYPQWGRHQVRATAKIKTTCGVSTITRKLIYDNQDPEPRAHDWS